MTPQDWDVLARRVDRGMERAADHLQQVSEKVEDADRRHRVRHEAGMAELAEIKKLPPVARFKAAMRFRP